MRTLNIASLIQARESLSTDSFTDFLLHYGVQIKDSEIEDIEVLCNALFELGADVGDLDGFLFGYKIPQIGKEFDILKFGRDRIINIEIKREGDEEIILKQLNRNKYYLGFAGKEVVGFTFISKDRALFRMGGNGDLESARLESLLSAMRSFEAGEIDDVDALFNPSDFLVSPFNSPQRFMSGQYFLTHQQEEIEARIIKKVTSDTKGSFFSLSGGPGTGKTLVIYDIARKLGRLGRSAVVIHCGNLNHGQKTLNESGFHIIPAKDIPQVDFGKFDMTIIDEAQRIYPAQLQKVIEAVELGDRFCLISHDGRQTLAQSETQNNVSARIMKIPGIEGHKLSEKIRSNAEIANFIKMLLDRSRRLSIDGRGNISINFFKDIDTADSYMSSLESGGGSSFASRHLASTMNIMKSIIRREVKQLIR